MPFWLVLALLIAGIAAAGWSLSRRSVSSDGSDRHDADPRPPAGRPPAGLAASKESRSGSALTAATLSGVEATAHVAVLARAHTKRRHRKGTIQRNASGRGGVSRIKAKDAEGSKCLVFRVTIADELTARQVSRSAARSTTPPTPPGGCCSTCWPWSLSSSPTSSIGTVTQLQKRDTRKTTCCLSLRPQFSFASRSSRRCDPRTTAFCGAASNQKLGPRSEKGQLSCRGQ